MNFVSCALLAFVCITNASFTAKINMKQCDSNGCNPVMKRIALDVGSNHTSSSGEELIIVSGADNDRLTLKYGGADVGGPRVYMIDGTEDKNEMFKLNSNEFTFDLSLSTMGCGFNAALYFVGMTENEGGAEKGTNYCDAQAVGGTFCSEMDVMEANTMAQQYTPHACIDTCASFSDDPVCKGNGSPKTVCDQNGCGLNPFRYGPGTTYNEENNNDDWYGPGSKYQLDSKQTYTVVTQFHETDSGALDKIKRFYLQNGKRIDLPTLYVKPPTDGTHMTGFAQPFISEDFCADIYDRWTGGEGNKPLAQMGKNMEQGMVLAMSAWYDKETYVNGRPQGSQTGMSWLDGLNNWGKLIKAGPCDETTSDAGGPYFATFSNIRFGKIGTTVPDVPPAPTPSPPTPPPQPSGQCCWGGCSSNCQGGWCGESKEHCEGNCNGKWCPSERTFKL